MFLLNIFYDQIASRSAAKPYMEMVDKSYLTSSDEVTTIIFTQTLFFSFNKTKKKNLSSVTF